MSESRDDLFDEYARAHVTRVQELLRKQEAYLIEAARQRRGRLTLEEIQAACRRMSEDKKELTQSLSGLVREFELWRGRRADAESRQNLLGRLMIQPFEHLCEGHFRGGVRQGALNRRMIPAFIQATGFLVGSTQSENWQEQLGRLLDNLTGSRQLRQDAHLWNEFYAHQQAKRVRLMMVARFLSRFSPYEKRRDWFMTYMNEHLARANEGTQLAGTEDAWHFQEEHYMAVMGAFTRELRELVRDKKKRQSFGLILPEERWPKLRSAISELSKELQGYE